MKILRFLPLLTTACVLFAGCNGAQEVSSPKPQIPTITAATETATATEITVTTTKKLTTTTEPTSEVVTTKAPVADSPEAEEPTEKPTKKPTTEAPVADSVSQSANGYEIKTVGGVTYVDGVLVANKTYALPASYYPGGLTAECDSAYDRLKAGAADAGYSLYISSGFRDYETQEVIYNRYVANDGKANADRYSARPGHSEHQTGLAIDLNGVSDSFGDTPTGQWVAAHCHEYGFILRYPKGKEAQTGYMYEPWHIRYVGVDTATKIAASGLCLEEYYGISSEYQN